MAATLRGGLNWIAVRFYTAGRPAEALLARIAAVPSWLQAVAGLALVAFYLERVTTVYRDTGLFRRIGFDWGLFYSQALALAAGDVGALYQLDRLGTYVQRLAVFTTTPDIPLLQWPAPYPPLLAGVLLPLTLVPPPIGFGIWTGLTLVCAAHLVWRAHQILPYAGPVRLGLIFFTTLPVVQTLVQGQPVLVLASAMAESYLALRRGADFRGGLWLGLIALKPQYGVLLGAFLLWKRRWYAVAGAAIGAGLVVGVSALLAGPGVLLDYANGVSAMGDFRDTFAQPGEMVNWRALIVNARPAIGNTSGSALFVVLSAITVLAVAWVARGRWRPDSRVLDLQLLVVIVATFLVSYHSHVHGLVLLAVPLAGLWRASSGEPTIRLTLLSFVFLPSVVFVWVAGISRALVINYDEPLWIVWPVLNAAVLVALLGSTLFGAWSAERRI